MAIDASDGSVWTWGANPDGELGNATTTTSATPVHVVGVGGTGLLLGVASVAGGFDYSLAAKSDGTVLAWGFGLDGELGDGKSTSSSTPVQVAGLTGAVGVAAGFGHSLAVDAHGAVWAWGQNRFGELGNNTTTNAATPVQVLGPGGTGFLANIVAVAAGEFFSVALSSNGTVWAWGDNANGELGNGSTTASSTPVQVSGLSSAVAIGAGDFHALAVVSDTTVWAWGDNSFGQLGNGSSGNSSSLVVHVRDTSGTGFVSGISGVAGGDGFSLAASSAGAAWGWGFNGDGELGIGTTVNHNFPQPVVGTGGTGTLSGVTLIAGISAHAGSLESNGTVTTWGSQGAGPPNGSSLSPQQITGLTTIAQPGPCPSGGPQPPPTPAPTPPAQTGGGSPSSSASNPCQQTSHPVNCATGEFWHRFLDLSVKGRGLGLWLARTYSSASASQDGPLGFGWTHSYNMSLSFNSDGSATAHEEGGSAITFAPGAFGAFVAPSWVFATLLKNGDGTYTLRRKDQTSFTFSSSGQLIHEQDRNGYQTTLAYSGGLLTTVTDATGRQLQFQYSGARITRITDPIGRNVSYQYDATGNLVAGTDEGGGVTKFTYDGSHLLLTMTDPNGGLLTNRYDAVGRVVSQSDPMNRTTSWAYGTGTTSITDPRSNATQETFQNGQLTTLIQGVGSAQAATWVMTYDPTTFALTSVKDPNGHMTTYTIDSRGNVLSAKNPLGNASTFTYDALNDPTSATDPLGATTQIGYDANGNVTTVSQPVSGSTRAVTTLAYDPGHPGDVLALTDTMNNTWHFTYDQAGDLTRAVDPLGNILTNSYDQASRLVSTVSPKGNVAGSNAANFTTSYGYDAFNNILTSVDPLGHTTAYQYDALQNLIRLTDANGHSTNYSYDPDNEPLMGTRAHGTQVQNVYDADGNLIGQIDPLGDQTSYGYDALNRLVSLTDALGRKSTVAYNAVGLPVGRTDAKGRSTSYSYDAGNQLTGIGYSDGITPNVSLAYDADGRRTQMTDGTGTSSYTYDSLGRLLQSINGAGTTVAYSYDLNGNQIGLGYPDGSRVNRTFDADGRLTSITDWLAHKTNFTYDANANLTSQAYPNGNTAKFTYDAADQLTAIADTGLMGQLTFTDGLDNIGQVTSESVRSGEETSQASYGYDKVNRLSSATLGGLQLGYQYDAADRLTTISKTSVEGTSTSTLQYDTADELLSLTRNPGGDDQSKLQYSYDANGNRIQRVDQRGIVTSYTYDQANRLVNYAGNAQYAYNGDGLRMTKTVSGVVEPFTWDISGQLPLVIQDGSSRYVTGAGGLPLEQVAADGTVRYYHQDALGSTRALTNTSGRIDSTYRYDPYGNLESFNGSSTPNPFQFAGQYTDAESGLQYVRARYYEPATAQFLTRDPLEGLSGHAYSYAGDNPTNFSDPGGLLSPTDLLTFVRDYAQPLSLIAGTLAFFFTAIIPILPVAGIFEGFSALLGLVQAYNDIRKRDFLGALVDFGSSVAGAFGVAFRVIASVKKAAAVLAFRQGTVASARGDLLALLKDLNLITVAKTARRLAQARQVRATVIGEVLDSVSGILFAIANPPIISAC